ncbi:MAG: adhesin [Actinoplanes sp.]
MRTSVGPLPSAVYWRRRAVVLGAVLLGIIVLFVSCSGNDPDDKKPGTSSSQLPTPAPATSTSPEPDESFVDGVPGGNNPALPSPDELKSSEPGEDGVTPGATLTLPPAGDGENSNVTAPADGSCSDSEISVTPIPAAKSVKRGVPLEIRLKIKNIGTRACNRDVGAGPQELYLDQGARKYWSSDTCGTNKASDLRQLQAGSELEYKVTWNGRQTSACQGGMPSGPNPAAGDYQLRGRLGTLVSDPVELAIVA